MGDNIVSRPMGKTKVEALGSMLRYARWAGIHPIDIPRSTTDAHGNIEYTVDNQKYLAYVRQVTMAQRQRRVDAAVQRRKPPGWMR